MELGPPGAVAPGREGSGMQEIVELERRIAAALERIGKGLDGLSAPAAMPAPESP